MVKFMKLYILSSYLDRRPDNKKLNTDIWYDAKTLIWLKARL